MNDEWWCFQAVEGFWWWTDIQTDNICECRVTFATENCEETEDHYEMFDLSGMK